MKKKQRILVQAIVGTIVAITGAVIFDILALHAIGGILIIMGFSAAALSVNHLE